MTNKDLIGYDFDSERKRMKKQGFEPITAPDSDIIIGYISSESDMADGERDFIKNCVLSAHERELKEERYREKVRSNKVPKPVASTYWNISDRD